MAGKRAQHTCKHSERSSLATQGDKVHLISDTMFYAIGNELGFAASLVFSITLSDPPSPINTNLSILTLSYRHLPHINRGMIRWLCIQVVNSLNLWACWWADYKTTWCLLRSLFNCWIFRTTCWQSDWIVSNNRKYLAGNQDLLKAVSNATQFIALGFIYHGWIIDNGDQATHILAHALVCLPTFCHRR